MKFKGRDGLLDTLLIVQMFPAALTVIAAYAIFDALGRVVPWLGIDSHPALILSYLSAITLPYLDHQRAISTVLIRRSIKLQ